MKLFKFIAPALLSIVLMACGGNTEAGHEDHEGHDHDAVKTECAEKCSGEKDKKDCASKCEEGEKEACCSADKKECKDKSECKDKAECSEECKAEHADHDCTDACPEECKPSKEECKGHKEENK